MATQELPNQGLVSPREESAENYRGFLHGGAARLTVEQDTGIQEM
jgi:hypothetical protein